MRALTSSDIAEKYRDLLDTRQAIADITLQQLKDSAGYEDTKRKQIEAMAMEKHRQEMKLLDIEVEIKLATLKKIRNE